MNSFPTLAPLAIALACTQLHAAKVSDDFSAPDLDTSLWLAETPNHNSHFAIEEGEAVFTNLGYLVTQQTFSSRVTVTGRFRITGNDHDVFNVRLRTDENFSTSLDWVIVQFAVRDNDFGPLGASNIAIYNSGGINMLKVDYPLQMGTYYNFKIIDDGSNVSVAINDLDKVLGSMAFTNRSGYKVAFSNREGLGSISSGSVSRLDSVTISDNGCDLPHRAQATATVVNGFLVGATLKDSGCGYTNVPVVKVVGGGGTGAEARAVVENGVVTEIVIENAGKGYTSKPILKIAPPTTPPELRLRVSKVIVDLKLTLGLRYQLLASKDLVAWSPVADAFTAEDDTLSQEFNAEETGQYFRVVQVQ